ncbi:hypothetical protein AC1031_000499 [Aphanomyces cochlioides]|nr:hypothetical protein AC1031_000499 [Aphanomyces cochlioides]
MPADEVWTSRLTAVDMAGLFALPLLSFLVIVALFTVLNKPKSKAVAYKSPNYGAIHHHFTTDDDDCDIIYAGHVTGVYGTAWTSTFDLLFIGVIAVLLLGLVVWTNIDQTALWSSSPFWLTLALKAIGLLVVSTLAGMVCRLFCVMDDRGYVQTTISLKFKISYTRQCQLAAAYLIPLLNLWTSAATNSVLELAWSYLAVLLCYLLQIKPLRERITWCMVQFNGIDLPDDRPHSLQWLVLNDLLSGFALLVCFKSLFLERPSLFVVLVLVVVVSCSVAEPVGSLWGQHKFSTKLSWITHESRTWESTAAIFITAMTMPAIMYQSFSSIHQVFTTMVVLPPVVACIDAVSPRQWTMPSLVLAAGAVLVGIVHVVA